MRSVGRNTVTRRARSAPFTGGLQGKKAAAPRFLAGTANCFAHSCARQILIDIIKWNMKYDPFCSYSRPILLVRHKTTDPSDEQTPLYIYIRPQLITRGAECGYGHIGRTALGLQGRTHNKYAPP